MKADNGFALGVGAGVLGVTAAHSGRIFERAVAAMNRQVEADLSALGSTGHLPDVDPALPLNYRPRGVFMLILTSLLWCFAGVGVIVFVVLMAVGRSDPDSTLFMKVFEAGVFGVMLAILTGWVPGIILYVIRQTRETARRVTEPIYVRYVAYWEERGLAQAALRDGAVEPVEVASRLEQHHLDHVLEDY